MINDMNELLTNPCEKCKQSDECTGTCSLYREYFIRIWRKTCEPLRKIMLDERNDGDNAK